MVRERLALKPLAEVRDIMRTAFTRPDRTVRVPVPDAVGRVTADSIYSPLTVPTTDIAARDGFAVVSHDTAGAGNGNTALLRNPHRVNTGNAIPPGYDAVVMIEDVTGGDGARYTGRTVRPGEHIHPAGEEIRSGDLILPGGHPVRPCDIGALLSSGITAIDVLTVEVGLISTGDEVIPAGGHPGPGEVIESNTAVAAALLDEAGASSTRYGIVPDDPELLRQAVERGIRENDLLMISAGSSAGTRDFTARVIAELGEVLVHGIAIKPGKPAIIGKIDGKPVIGMPGYPIAALTVVRELALPLLAGWGFYPHSGERVSARISRTIRSDPGFDEFVVLTVSRTGNHYVATPAPRGAGMQMTLVRANAYLHVPAGIGSISKDSEVEVLLTVPRELIRESNASTGQ